MYSLKNYYLYLFYWKELDNGNVKAAGGFWFVWLNLFFQFLVLFIATTMHFDPQNSIYQFFLNLGGRVETHKGTINAAFTIFMFTISALTTYLLCCYQISKNEAVERLSNSNFFKTPSYLKIYAPLAVFIFLFIFLLG